MDLHNFWRGWRGQRQAATVAAQEAELDKSAELAELMQLGMRHREGKDHAAAARSLQRAIEIKYDCGEAHHALGLVYLDEGHCEDAVDCFELATHFAPRLALAHVDLGAGLLRLGRHAAAETACRRALDLDPRLAAAWFVLGNICKSRNDLERAVECYRTSVAHDPELSGAHCQLAFVLYRLGRYSESRACHAAALRVKPDFAEVHHNLGLLLIETGCPAEALASFERALALPPAKIETKTCIAHALRDLGHLDLAVEQYDRVLRQQSQLGDAVINRCYALLMREDYAAGWAAYERRHEASGSPDRGFPFSEWRGEPLTGKRILVYAEQGVGDEIMFASCLPDVIARAAHVIIQCNIRLARLFAYSFPSATIHGAGKDDDRGWLQSLPRADFQVAFGSLPGHFRRTRSAFPLHLGYLTADGSRGEFWRSWLGASTGRLRVGIAWRGGSLRTRQWVRSTRLEQWMPMVTRGGVDFISLQYGDAADEVEQCVRRHGKVVREAHGTEDLGDLAALMSALDLVITVDNTVAHLAGALGRPLWILLPFSAEWRYLREGTAMRWYPSAKLFRQPRPRDWEAVFSQVEGKLQQLSEARVV